MFNTLTRISDMYTAISKANKNKYPGDKWCYFTFLRPKTEIPLIPPKRKIRKNTQRNVPVNPGFTSWIWSLRASTLQVRLVYIKTESEMGVGYAQMCIKTAVYVNQEHLDQGSLLALS